MNYYLPTKKSSTISIQAFNYQTSPSSVNINFERKFSYIHFFIGGRYYLSGDYESNFGFYGLAEVGLIMVLTTKTIGAYDQRLYSSRDKAGKEGAAALSLGLGAGVEKKLGFGYLFSALKFNLPGNRANEAVLEIEVPISMGIDLGVRIPF
jgi:hypothetical protein